MSENRQRYCPECFGSFGPKANVCPEHGIPLIELPSQESLVGKTIDGKYEVLELLGQGGMGTVYRARQRLIGREVALKVLRGEFVQDVGAVKRFFVEAKAASQLRNRHSVILYDFGLSDESLLFYTMELLNGRALSSVLGEAGCLSPKSAVQIVVDVCHSLEDAHSRGIIHRDLKPDNIMIVQDGDEQIAKVLDFGIAKLLSRSDGTGLTATGMVCGTPEYMSPEQASGKEVGPTSDIYAVGAVLFEMLAGRPPFEDSTPVLVLMKHISETPPTVGEISPDLHLEPWLDGLLRRMLSKSPDLRPQSVAELRDEIRTGLSRSGGTTMPEGRLLTSLSIARPSQHQTQPQHSHEDAPTFDQASVEDEATEDAPGRRRTGQPKAAPVERRMETVPFEEEATDQDTEFGGTDAYAPGGSPTEYLKHTQRIDRGATWASPGVIAISVLVCLGLGLAGLFAAGIFDSKSESTRTTGTPEPVASVPHAGRALVDVRIAKDLTTEAGTGHEAKAVPADIRAQEATECDAMTGHQDHPVAQDSRPEPADTAAPAVDTVPAVDMLVAEAAQPDVKEPRVHKPRDEGKHKAKATGKREHRGNKRHPKKNDEKKKPTRETGADKPKNDSGLGWDDIE